MKICICSSLTFTNEVLEVAKMLENLGHEVLLPNGIANRLIEQPGFDPTQAKIKTDSWHLHFDKIQAADAILICNFLKNCTPGYIGANTFSELTFAYYCNKPLFTLFPLPDQAYINDEIRSLPITVLNNDFSLLAPAQMMTAPLTVPANNTAAQADSKDDALELPTIDPRQAEFALPGMKQAPADRPVNNDTPETSLTKLSKRLKTLLCH